MSFAVDPERNSFFAEDLGDNYERLFNDDEDAITEQDIQKVAKFHIQAVHVVDQVQEPGVLNSSPLKLKNNLRRFISELQEKAILDEHQVEDMIHLIPETKTLLNGLINGKIPIIVCHGDLDLSNTQLPEDDEPRLFDWYECTVSHPFLDIMSSELGEAETFDVYLKIMQKFESTRIQNLKKLSAIANTLIPLWETYRILEIRAKRKYRLGWKVDQNSCRISMSRFANSLKIHEELSQKRSQL